MLNDIRTRSSDTFKWCEGHVSRPRLPDERTRLLAGRSCGPRLHRDGPNVFPDVFHRLCQSRWPQVRLGQLSPACARAQVSGRRTLSPCLPTGVRCRRTMSRHNIGIAARRHCAVAACGFALAARGDRWSLGFGGAVVGIAIGVMHYVGMHALLVPGHLSWDASLIISSLVIGVVLSAAAMLAFHRKTGTRRLPPQVAFSHWRFAACTSRRWAR